MKLSERQIDAFHEEGYLLLEDVLKPADLQPVIDEIDAEIDGRARRLHEAGKLSQIYEDEGFETRLTRITTETEDLYWSISSGQLAGPAIFALLIHPSLLDLAESLVGPEIIASSVYRLRPKVPGFGHGVVPWHQDSGYFEPYCDESLVLTMWIPLVDATPERGCLQVIPRVHKSGIVRHYQNSKRRYLEIFPEDLPEGDIVTTPVPFGGVLLLTNRTPHQSIPNTTDVIRWSMDLRYQSAALPTNYEPLAAPERAEGVPLACYPPEADFLVRSDEHPDKVVRQWEAFHRIRTSHARQSVTRRWDAR